MSNKETTQPISAVDMQNMVTTAFDVVNKLASNSDVNTSLNKLIEALISDGTKKTSSETTTKTEPQPNFEVHLDVATTLCMHPGSNKRYTLVEPIDIVLDDGFTICYGDDCNSADICYTETAKKRLNIAKLMEMRYLNVIIPAGTKLKCISGDFELMIVPYDMQMRFINGKIKIPSGTKMLFDKMSVISETKGEFKINYAYGTIKNKTLHN